MRVPALVPALLLASQLLLAALPGGAASRDQGAADTGDGAEGFWIARMPDGVNVKWAILDGGETWGIYEAQGIVLGAFHGLTRSGNGALSGHGLAYDIPSNTVGATDFTGSYIARQAISLTTQFGATVSGHYVPGYDQPANLAHLQGHYDGEGLSSRTPVFGMRMSVTPEGAFILQSQQACAASGSATPRPGGKNVFNVRLHFAGRDCPLGDGAHATGIAHVSTATGELFVLAMNEAKTDGWLYLGTREAD